MNFFLLILILAVSLSCKPPKDIETVDVSDPQNQAIVLIDIWVLEEIDGVTVTEKDFANEIPLLEFHSDKKVMGNSGCNRISGTYFIEDGDKISFGPMISTKMACPGDGEQRFLNALNSVKRFKVENLKLYLLDGDSEKLQFKKVD